MNCDRFRPARELSEDENKAPQPGAMKIVLEWIKNFRDDVAKSDGLEDSLGLF